MEAPVRHKVTHPHPHMMDRGLRVAGEVKMASRREEQTEEGEDAALELSLGPVVHFLQSALKNREEGDSRHYKLLVQQIACKRDQDTLLMVYLGLAQCVELLCERPESYKELVLVLFRFDWDQPRPIIDAYHKLLSQLVSANSTYVLPALHSIVRVLAPEDGGKFDAYERIQPYAHRSLSAILSLAPSGVSKLFSVLSRQYPHKRLPPIVQEGYCRQLLSVAAYVPILEPRVLRLIVQRGLEIDVEIKITDAGDAVRDTESGDGVFDMDDVLHGPSTTESPALENVDEMAQKLDVIMLVLFEYLRANLGSDFVTDGEHENNTSPVLCNVVSNPPKDAGVVPVPSSTFSISSVDRQKRLFGALLGVFEDSILLTHQSKFVQFVVFYAGGLSPEFSQIFVNRLLKICFDEEKSVVVRQSGVAYLASYMARAAFVEKGVLSLTLTSILQWIVRHISKYDMAGDLNDTSNNNKTFSEASATISISGSSSLSLNSRNGGKPHLLFYSFCQAAFYIMCFHVDKLCDHARLHMSEWTRILRSRLHPLRYCLSAVRWEFSRLCDIYLRDDLPVDVLKLLRRASIEGEKASKSIIKPSSGGFNCEKGGAMNSAAAWSKLRYRGTSSSHVGGGSSQQTNLLDSFFPFDPYLLKRSHVFIEGMYCYWDTRSIVPECFKRDDSDSELDSNSSETDSNDGVKGENDVDPDSSDNDDANSLVEGMASTFESCASSTYLHHSAVVEPAPMSFGCDRSSSRFNGTGEVAAMSFGGDSVVITPQSLSQLGDSHLSATSVQSGSSLDDDREFHRSVVSISKPVQTTKRSKPAMSYTSLEDDGW